MIDYVIYFFVIQQSKYIVRQMPPAYVILHRLKQYSSFKKLNVNNMEQNNMLFSEYTLGSLHLKNRIVMAPMTRSRAIGNVPNDLMAKYYSERAGAGLIITEGTSPAPNGLGYARIPGMYSGDQIKGWKAVTDAVHAKGGKIFIQLMHTGRIAHPLNMPENSEIIAPSAIAAAGQMWTDTQGMQAQPAPKEIPTNEIQDVIAAYAQSAKAAIEAGFDGVEIHAANGYLPNQFLSPGSNKRTDSYGGSHENRNRFVLELAEGMIAAIGKEKVGIRLSPFNKFNDITPDEQEEAQYVALTKGLAKAGVVYIHLLTFAMPATLLPEMHKAYSGTFILNGGYDTVRAEKDLESGAADLVSFGRNYIGNPDLTERIQKGSALAAADEATFYTPGEKGYIDYPVMQEA
jgi:N-ethylmaleimide reductase